MAQYRIWYAVVCVCLFLGWQAKAQPVINTIGSGLNGPNPTATLPAAITVDTNLPNGFVLIMDGQFSPPQFIDVTWFNPSTSQTLTLSASSVTTTEVQVPIPPSAFQGFFVNSPQTVTVT